MLIGAVQSNLEAEEILADKTVSSKNIKSLLLRAGYSLKIANKHHNRFLLEESKRNVKTPGQ